MSAESMFTEEAMRRASDLPEVLRLHAARIYRRNEGMAAALMREAADMIEGLTAKRAYMEEVVAHDETRGKAKATVDSLLADGPRSAQAFAYVPRPEPRPDMSGEGKLNGLADGPPDDQSNASPDPIAALRDDIAALRADMPTGVERAADVLAVRDQIDALRAEVREMAAAVERKSTPVFHLTMRDADGDEAVHEAIMEQLRGAARMSRPDVGTSEP